MVKIRRRKSIHMHTGDSIRDLHKTCSNGVSLQSERDRHRESKTQQGAWLWSLMAEGLWRVTGGKWEKQVDLLSIFPQFYSALNCRWQLSSLARRHKSTPSFLIFDMHAWHAKSCTTFTPTSTPLPFHLLLTVLGTMWSCFHRPLR